MKTAFFLLFVAALCVQVFQRLSRSRQAALLAALSKAQAMFNQAVNAVRNTVFRRRMAYKRLFLDHTGQRLNEDGRAVIAHLAKLCRATTGKGIASQGPMGATIDTNATMIAVGRNEVFQAIMKELHLDMGAVFQALKEEDALAA